MLQGIGLSSGVTLWATTAQALVTSAGGKFAIGLAAASVVGLGALPFVQERARTEAERAQAVQFASAPVASSEVVAPPFRPERARATVPSIDDSPNELRAQIELLDQVTQAVNRGDRAHASALLDRFDQQFPTGILQREARALRRSARKLAASSH
jgi:hypothetical protein